MGLYHNDKVNNASTGNGYIRGNRPARYLGYDETIKKVPESVELSSFDAAGLAGKLHEVKNDPIQEAEGIVLTPRMNWVQNQLEEMDLKYFDTKYKNDWNYSSYITAVPFISDFGKAASFYIASTNQYEEKGKYTSDRLSSVVMALALAAQLKESKENKNVVILFVNQHNLHSSVQLIEDFIQKRCVNVSVGAIVELCYFVGKFSISESRMLSTAESIFKSLLNKSGQMAVTDLLSYCLYADRLSEYEYESLKFGSTINDESYEKLLDENEEEVLFTAEKQIEFCSSIGAEIIYTLLYQHAILMSSFYYYNEVDNRFKH